MGLRGHLTASKLSAMNAADFIDAKGGPAAVAVATGYKAGAVSLWKHRRKLPRSAWPEILEAYPDVTMDELKAIEAAGGGDDCNGTPEAPGAAA